MSSVNSKDRVSSHSVKEDIQFQFDRVVEALGKHLSGASEAAVSRSLSLIVLIPVKEDTHSSMV